MLIPPTKKLNMPSKTELQKTYTLKQPVNLMTEDLTSGELLYSGNQEILQH